MSANWFVTKNVKPEDKMPDTEWLWIVDPCDLCPKSSTSECKAWEACTRKKRAHPNPKLRLVNKSEVRKRAENSRCLRFLAQGNTNSTIKKTTCTTISYQRSTFLDEKRHLYRS